MLVMALLALVVCGLIAVLAYREVDHSEARVSLLESRAEDLVWALRQDQDPHQPWRVRVATARLRAALGYHE